MAKRKGKRPKIYVTGGRSSYNAGFNLGKGQLDRLADKKISNTTLTPNEKEEIENDWKEWGFEYFAGLFPLGKNSDNNLKKIWPDLRWALVHDGIIVVIRKKAEKDYYYLLADIHVQDKVRNIKKNLGGEIVKLKVVYRKRKDIVGNLVLDDGEINENDFSPNDYVIFRNNSLELPELRRGQRQLNKIIEIEEQFSKDLKVSRPRIIAYHPIISDKNKAAQLKDYIFEETNDLITIASLNEGDKPTLHDWPGGSRQADLWANYSRCLTEWKRLNGIRTMTNKKKQTQLTSEVEMIEEQFEALENNRYDSMITSLEECLEKWKWNYSLLKPDQKEEDEAAQEIKQLEKQVKIAQLKNFLKELEKNEISQNLDQKQEISILKK